MYFKKYNLLIFVLPLFFLSGGCKYFKLLNFRLPEVKSIKKVVVKKVSFNNARFIFTVEVDNTNDFDLLLKSGEYEVYMEDKYLGKGNLNEQQTILKNSINELDFPVTISLYDAIKNGFNFLSVITGNENIKYKTKGKFKTVIEGINTEFEIPLEIENYVKTSSEF